MKIVRTRIYERKSAKLLSEEEKHVAENEIILAPEKWPVIIGTGGVRKARAARGGSGKSGGVRIMYYFWAAKENIYLMDVFAKNEKANISGKDKKFLIYAVEELKKLEN